LVLLILTKTEWQVHSIRYTKDSNVTIQLPTETNNSFTIIKAVSLKNIDSLEEITNRQPATIPLDSFINLYQIDDEDKAIYEMLVRHLIQ